MVIDRSEIAQQEGVDLSRIRILRYAGREADEASGAGRVAVAVGLDVGVAAGLGVADPAGCVAGPVAPCDTPLVGVAWVSWALSLDCGRCVTQKAAPPPAASTTTAVTAAMRIFLLLPGARPGGR